MKKALIEFCKSIRLEHVGIAPSGPYNDLKDLWEKRIEKGFVHAFNKGSLEKMICPNLTLEDAKSVIVCLFPYYCGNFENANLSKYAYSVDYHITVKNMLEKIGDFLQKKIQGFNYEAFADTGPLNDRYLAYKAGLGFFGINNHIITDEYGSYVFIGYIISNYPFEPDKPQDRTCRKCFDCVKRCPGQCILGDFTINPFKCRSYISQKKGELSAEDMEILKKNPLIWGCDVCQDVCHHNQSIKKTVIEDFKNNLKYRIEYEELEEISNNEFFRRYKDRAFSWRGKGVLKRNYEIINEL